MSANSKKIGKNIAKVDVTEKVDDYSNDPFFVKKVEASKKVIEKYGIPKSLLTNKK